MVTGTTKLVGLFADPAEHSLSPQMHNTAFQACGIDATYLAFTIDQKMLPDALQSIRTFHMLGANLSMPNKEIVLPLLDEISLSVELIGACNTIIHRNGKLIGHNTDGIGFMQSIKEKNISIVGKKLTVLGAGGAAKAVAVQAALEGAEEIVLYKRKNATFESVAQEFARINERTECTLLVRPFEDRQQLAADLAESALLVNATDIGMGGKIDQNPLPEGNLLRADLPVVDLIYRPAETRLLAAAKEKGAVTINGSGMLIYQGAAAFHLWTGQKMPIEKIKPLLQLEEKKK